VWRPSLSSSFAGGASQYLFILNGFNSCVILLQIAFRQYDMFLIYIYIYIYLFIYFYSSIYVYIVYMVGTRLHSGTFYGCVSKSGFCKFHEFPIEFAISRWWLPDLGHTLISAVKRKHNLDLIGLTRLLFHLQRSSACVRTRCRCLVGCVFFHSSGPWTRGSDGINKDGFLFHAPQVEKLTGNSFF